MKKKQHLRLWIYFASIVFVLILIITVVLAVLIFSLFRSGYFSFDNSAPPFIPGMFLLLVSVIIGTVFSLVVAKKILNPITVISKASNEVAKGNFEVRLEENSSIREIRELTRNFNLMARELSGIETLRSDFVVNVSHEFKTPIASIEGYATLLQDKELSDRERDEYTQIIINSARQLATLSENILTLSKLENQELVLEKESFRLDEQLRQAVLILEPEWSAKELDLQIDLEKIVYYGNEKLLRQVWVNMIGNAVKFTPRGGSVEARLFGDGENVVVRISDTGCGMDGDVQKHIFDKFYQADAARKHSGNGLGLALVKRITDLCGGKIAVESRAGAGAVFTITLPG